MHAPQGERSLGKMAKVELLYFTYTVTIFYKSSRLGFFQQLPVKKTAVALDRLLLPTGEGDPALRRFAHRVAGNFLGLMFPYPKIVMAEPFFYPQFLWISL